MRDLLELYERFDWLKFSVIWLSMSLYSAKDLVGIL